MDDGYDFNLNNIVVLVRGLKWCYQGYKRCSFKSNCDSNRCKSELNNVCDCKFVSMVISITVFYDIIQMSILAVTYILSIILI